MNILFCETVIIKHKACEHAAVCCDKSPVYLSLFESEFLLSVTELLLHLRVFPHRHWWLWFL